MYPFKLHSYEANYITSLVKYSEIGGNLDAHQERVDGAGREASSIVAERDDMAVLSCYMPHIKSECWLRYHRLFEVNASLWLGWLHL